MTYMRMPMFCWTTLASILLIVAAFPQSFSGCPFSQCHHRRGALWRVRRLHLLVPEGVWLPVARRAWQGVVLVLVHRILRRFHAALRRRPNGNDASHAALRCPGLASVAADRGRRRRDHTYRDNLADRAVRRQHSPTGGTSREGRSSFERNPPRG